MKAVIDMTAKFISADGEVFEKVREENRREEKKREKRRGEEKR